MIHLKIILKTTVSDDSREKFQEKIYSGILKEREDYDLPNSSTVIVDLNWMVKTRADAKRNPEPEQSAIEDAGRSPMHHWLSWLFPLLPFGRVKSINYQNFVYYSFRDSHTFLNSFYNSAH